MGGGFVDYYAIGQRIRAARRAHGLSQEQLAERVNISTTHMSHIETGNTKLSLPVLVDIAATLSVRTDDLLSDGADYSGSRALDEIATVMQGCTPREARVVSDVVKATAKSLKVNRE